MFPFFNNYPGTDLHEIDLAYILKVCNEMLERVREQDDKIAAVEQLAQDLQDFVNNYFDNLNVQTEINNKINAMVTDGSLMSLIEDPVTETAAAWLADNITPTTPPVDSSLTIAGAAADAKATGDAINRTAGMYAVSPTWEQGNISGTGAEVDATTRARMTVGVKTVPGSILRIVNKFTNKFIGVAINYYDSNNVWQSQNADHWTGNANVIHVGNSLEVDINSYGYVRCSINLQGSPEITNDMLTALQECFEVYTNENIFDLYAAVEGNGTSVDEIKTVRNLQTDGSICFTWMSDSHYQVNRGVTYGTPITLFEESGIVADNVKSDFFIHTGDIVNGNSDIAYQEDDLVDVVNAFSKCKLPVWMIEGNHDDNSWYMKNNGDSAGTYQGMAQVLTNERLTSYIMNNQLNHVKVDPANSMGGYFYKDFKKAKIRVICLNTTDIPYIQNADGTLKYYGQWTMGFQADQMNWLANTALKFTEAGWGVVFFMHYDGQLDDALANTIVDPKCWTYVKQIIAAYRARSSGTIASSVTDFPANFSYDFTQNASNTVCAYFSGHVHKDQYAIIDGVPHVSIVCSFDDGQSSGYGFDIVTLDRTRNRITTLRYNNGAMPAYNRVISW